MALGCTLHLAMHLWMKSASHSVLARNGFLNSHVSLDVSQRKQMDTYRTAEPCPSKWQFRQPGYIAGCHLCFSMADICPPGRCSDNRWAQPHWRATRPTNSLSPARHTHIIKPFWWRFCGCTIWAPGDYQAAIVNIQNRSPSSHYELRTFQVSAGNHWGVPRLELCTLYSATVF
jgi:hypothetical protein